MADGTEIRAVFEGARDTAAQITEDAAAQMGKLGDGTLQRATDSLDLLRNTEDGNTDLANGIRDKLGTSGEPGLSGPGSGAPASGGGTPSRITQMLNPGGDSAIRKMSSEEPGMGWKNFKNLSPKAKSLARALDDSGVVDINPGEAGVKNLAELTKGYNGEVGIIQDPEGNLKMIKGKGTRTTIPKNLFTKGYRFLVHTHPEDKIPGDFNEIDKIRGIKSSMHEDLEFRRNGASTHIEAVVNKIGDITYFDHNGIISIFDHTGKYDGELPVSGRSIPDGPINDHGFVFPVRSR